MNKKAFTLIELLAVIVIISIVGLITVPIILDNIEKSRMEMYRSNTQTAMDVAKEYVSKNTRNNDFPKGGIDITTLDIKNSNFKSGIINRCPTSNFEGTDCDKKNLEPGEIYAENIYNGKYCANGTKNNIIVSKVKSKKECELIDSTGPELSVKLIRVTNNSILVNAYGFDSQTKILKYTFQIGKEEPIEIYTDKTIATYEFTGLKRVEGTGGYDVTVTVSNVNALSEDEQYKKNPATHTTIDTSLKGIELREVGLPTFKVSGNNYANTKEITITYPSIVDGENYYIIGDNAPVKVNNSITKIAISENVRITAYIVYGNNRVENSINIAGIDDKGPNLEVLENNTWEQQKVLTVMVKDMGAGLGRKSCSFDGGNTWVSVKKRTINGEQKTVCEKVYSSNQTVDFIARDKLGNISTLDIEITHVDSTPPSCTTIYASPINYNGDWTNQNVILRGKCEDDLSGCEGDISFTYTTDKNSTYLPSIDGIVRDKAGNTTVCSTLPVKIDKTPPKCNGKIGGNTSWTNQNITVGAYCKDDQLEFNSSCREDYYLDQLTTDGMQETKSILIYDKAGNVTNCSYTYDKYIDKTPPTCGSPTGGNTSWKKGSIDVGVNCNDGTNTSGCIQSTFYSTLSSTGTTENRTITIKDRAGNTKECTNTYNKYLDNTAPKCSGQTGGKSYWTKNQNVTVGARCQDSESGCSRDEVTSIVNGHGKTEYKTITISDKVGNVTTCGYTYNKYIDTVAPTYSLTGTSCPTGSGYQYGTELKVSCSDADSGAVSNSKSQTVTKNGTVNLTCEDNVGNTSTINANISVCTYGSHVSCGANWCTNVACGCQTSVCTSYKFCNNQACGCQTETCTAYKYCTHKDCGCQSSYCSIYKTCQNSACGCLISRCTAYKTCATSACGTYQCNPYTCGYNTTSVGCWSQSDCSMKIAQGYSCSVNYTRNSFGIITGASGTCTYRNPMTCYQSCNKTCANAACGCQTETCSTYQTCQNKACGCQTETCTAYKYCQTSACGCQTSVCNSYKYCQNQACGCQTEVCTAYKYCQNAACGYQSCWHY